MLIVSQCTINAVVLFSEQQEMKKLVRLVDVCPWQLERCVNGIDREVCGDIETESFTAERECLSQQSSVSGDVRPLTYVAGVDISFVKDDSVNACAACVVTKLPEFEVRNSQSVC